MREVTDLIVADGLGESKVGIHPIQGPLANLRHPVGSRYDCQRIEDERN
jgi:hypothetical protein